MLNQMNVSIRLIGIAVLVTLLIVGVIYGKYTISSLEQDISVITHEKHIAENSSKVLSDERVYDKIVSEERIKKIPDANFSDGYHIEIIQ